MTTEAKGSGKKAAEAGAVELDETELDDVAGGNFQSSSSSSVEQNSTTQTADGKYVVNKLVGRPK